MARRSGKASRQSRQRRAQRAASRPAAPRPAAPSAPEAAAPSAFDAADAAARAAGKTAAPAIPRTVRSHPADPRFQVAGPSRLSERAVAEYHYVVRDLRNIAVLVGVMIILLALATIVVRAMEIGQV
jgi:hypothetical protein